MSLLDDVLLIILVIYYVFFTNNVQFFLVCRTKSVKIAYNLNLYFYALP